MSATAFEAKGPNKAVYRTAALAGSALIWGTLGYLALTYVPVLKGPGKILVDLPPIVMRPDPILIEPPLPVKDPTPKKQAPISQTPDPTPILPTLAVRPSTSPHTNPLQSIEPAGPAPTAPAINSGDLGGSIPIAPTIAAEVPVIAVPPIPDVVPDPPKPQLVINPVKRAGANPVYPSRPLDAGISGEVTLSFTVTPSGQVEGITILSEEPRRYGFARAAQEAIATWTFQPQTIDGVPVAYPARYTISFKLED